LSICMAHTQEIAQDPSDKPRKMSAPFSMALVRVDPLRAQDAFSPRQFDDMDDWLEDQADLGLGKTLTMLVRHHSSRRQQQKTQPVSASQQHTACRPCTAIWSLLVGSTPPASRRGCSAPVCCIVDTPLRCCCPCLPLCCADAAGPS
jgi:hypothetical protein